MKIGNTTLIPQNVAPSNATGLAIYSGDRKICDVDISKMIPQNLGEKKYCVGLLSDTHTTTLDSFHAANTQSDLTTAIRWLSANAEMTCVCGDLSEFNNDGGLGKHKEIVNANKGGMEVYEMPGNHEHYNMEGVLAIMDDNAIKQYTGFPLYYTVTNQPTNEAKRNYYSPTVDEDVYIMCGAVAWNPMFNNTNFRWLYETLEANRNKRCFLFFHAPIDDAQHCGDALNVITYDGLGDYKSRFINLLRHYKNAIYFHGHTHAMLEMQDYLQGLNPPLPANYDFTDGIHSVHIPSLAISRDISNGTRVDVVATSQGYLMDVYANHIVLKGRDFVKGEFIPIAHYCLDTTLKSVESKPFSAFA